MSGRISVRDVAAAAGVSIGSVSRVLNDSGYSSQDLRKRVLSAVDALGYEPDFTARHLRTGRSKAIGYMLPNFANPVPAAHLSEVERLTREAGYSLLVGTSDKPVRDRELVAFYENRRLEGIIASPSFEYPDPKDIQSDTSSSGCRGERSGCCFRLCAHEPRRRHEASDGLPADAWSQAYRSLRIGRQPRAGTRKVAWLSRGSGRCRIGIRPRPCFHARFMARIVAGHHDPYA